MDRYSQIRSDPQVPVEHTRKRLMGEAAYQRMLCLSTNGI